MIVEGVSAGAISMTHPHHIARRIETKRLLVMTSAALLLVSCDNDEHEAWTASQSNSAKTVNTATLNVSQAAAIDFNTATADSVQLFIPKVISRDSVVSQTLTAVLSYNNKIATLNISKKSKVKSSEPASVVKSLYGKSGDLHQVTITVTDKVKLLRGEGFSLSQSATTNVTRTTPAFAQYLYMPGDADGWPSSNPLYSVATDSKCTGLTYLNQNGFKFVTEQDWSGTDYGIGLIEKDSNIMMAELAGFYKADVDPASQVLIHTAIGRVSIIGSATAGGWNSDQAMTYNVTEKCWEIKGITLTAGEIKFRASNDQVPDQGGSLTDIIFKGGNINVATGKHNIKFYLLCDTKSHCTMEAAPQLLEFR